MMKPRSTVVPANAGTHNHRTEFWSLTAVSKATHIVLTNNLHGVWVPAFAGTTG
jgi:hypothetical protein